VADKDDKGKRLAERVHASERRLGKAMSKTIDHKELEAARREHREAVHEHQAHLDGRSYGSGVREK
jgi:hypothetical protein